MCSNIMRDAFWDTGGALEKAHAERRATRQAGALSPAHLAIGSPARGFPAACKKYAVSTLPFYGQQSDVCSAEERGGAGAGLWPPQLAVDRQISGLYFSA